MKTPRGENRAPEDRATTLVGDPQPAHLIAIGHPYMLFRIHLPGLVGHDGALPVDDRIAAGRGGGQVVLDEPSLQRAHRGDDLRGHCLQQLHADKTGAPSRVRAAQPQGGLDRPGWLDRDVGGARVGRLQALRAAGTKSRQESADGRRDERQCGGDFGSVTTLLPEPKRGQTDRNGCGAGHGLGSQRRHHGPEHPRLYQCSGASKLGVAIRASKLGVA